MISDLAGTSIPYLPSSKRERERERDGAEREREIVPRSTFLNPVLLCLPLRLW